MPDTWGRTLMKRRAAIHSKNRIINEVSNAVGNWKSEAQNIGISRKEIQIMESAFRWV